MKNFNITWWGTWSYTTSVKANDIDEVHDMLECGDIDYSYDNHELDDWEVRPRVTSRGNEVIG